jgi:hypothetical protein
MNASAIKIDFATHKAAKFACENWHYSKCVPVGKLVKIGIWECEKFTGVVLFGRGATPNLGKPYSMTQTECVELVRIAMREHETPVSKIVSVALKFLKKTNPNIKLVVSFADQSQGHHGGIYQAGNWVYAGQGQPAKFYMINGKLTHPRSIGAKGLTQNIEGARRIDKSAHVVDVPGKHRYLMPLDKKTRKQIVHLSKPYPKRAKQAMADDQSAQRQGSTDPHAPIGQVDV